jgi:hypothetical protein
MRCGHSPRENQSMKLIVTLERDETAMIVSECLAIPGCVSQGKSETDADIEFISKRKQRHRKMTLLRVDR